MGGRTAPAVAAAAIALLAPAATGSVRVGPVLTRHEQLFVVSPSGDSIRRITSDRHDRYDPVWSPDGELIASDEIAGQRNIVEVRTKRGKLVRRFDAGDQAIDTPPSWSPDGRWLAFPRAYDNRQREATDGKLVVARLDGRKERVLADLAVDKPAWAPDGRSILYLHGDIAGSYTAGDPIVNNEYELWRVSSDGSGTPELVMKKVSGTADYSPDGKRIIFFRAPNGWGDALWEARADGSRQHRLSGPQSEPEARWAPKGLGIWLQVAGRKHARAFLFMPSGERRRLPSAIRTGPMDWSPDANLIAWGDGPLLKRIHPDGTGSRKLLRFRTKHSYGFGYCDSLDWRPDGRQFLVGCREDVSD